MNDYEYDALNSLKKNRFFLILTIHSLKKLNVLIKETTLKKIPITNKFFSW